MQPSNSPSYPPYPVSAADANRTDQTESFPSPFISQVPPTPPTMTTATGQGGQPWRTAFLAVVMLLILVVGIGLALVATHANASNASKTTTSSSAPISLPASVQDLQQTVIATSKNVEPSIVEVHSSGRGGSAVGSGEFLTADGYIVTNNHVVANFSAFSVTLADGTNHVAQVKGNDATDDLAVLKIDVTNAQPITFTDSSQAQVGQFVLALGSPLDLQGSVSFGIVSALNRTQQEDASTGGFGSSASGPVLTGLIQTSAPINPGNSGGALVDLQGRLLGIPTLGATGTSQGETISGIGFAIPSNRVKTVTAQLMQGGQVTSSGQGFLGIQGQDVTAADGLSVNQGVIIRGFANDAAGSSPAQTAGLQVNDIITAVNNRSVTSSNDLGNIILPLAPNTKVSVTVARGTGQTTVTVTLGERPQS